MKIKINNTLNLLGSIASLLGIIPLKLLSDKEHFYFYLIIPIIISIFLFIIWIVKRYFGLTLETNGLRYIKHEIDKCMKNGGELLSTAIFEISTQDEVTEYIKRNIDKVMNKFLYARFVLLDNPTLQYIWMTDFLKLKNKLFTPRIYHVDALKRQTSRKLIKSIPRYNIVLSYSYAKKIKKLNKIYVGFTSSKYPFGITIRNKRIISTFEYNILSFIEKTTPIEDYHLLPIITEKDFSKIFFQNIVSLLEDDDFTKKYINDDILFVGAFGSCGLILQKRYNFGFQYALEGDIDLIILISSQSNKEYVKKIIQKKIMREFNILKNIIGTNKNCTIEFSNLEGRYYEYRKKIHIDIQLHQLNDEYDIDYYVNENKARLLGYSIFDKSFYTIYTYKGKCFKEYGLLIPDTPLDMRDRVNLVLDSNEYGIRTAYSRIDDINYGKTDPRRLFWNVLQNYTWAMTGDRKRNKTELVKFINKEINCINNEMNIVIENFDNKPLKNLRKEIKKIIKIIIEELEKCIQ